MTSAINLLQKHKIAGLIGLALVVATAFWLSGGLAKVMAISHIGPDRADFGGSSNAVRYALENSPSTSGTTQLKLPIYYDQASRPTAKVNFYSFYYWNNEKWDAGAKRYRLDYGTKHVLPGYQYKLNNGSWGSCLYPKPGSNRTITVNPSRFTKDSNSGMWKAMIDIRMCSSWNRSNKFDGNLINFRINLTKPTSKRYVGFSPQGSGKYMATANQSPKNEKTWKYSIPMALPCDITKDTWVDVDLYDLDDSNSDNGGHKISVDVVDADTGKKPSIKRSGSMASNKNYKVKVLAKPGARYKVNIQKVWSRNVLVYNLEYDNISYITRCPRPAEWNVNGQSYIKKNSASRVQSNITAAPGDTIRWDHDLRNTGPDNMDRSTDVHVNRIDYSLSTGNQISYKTDYHGKHKGKDNELYFKTNNSYTIPQSKVGQRLCQRIQWNPKSSAQSGWTPSTMRCVSIPYSYTLNPYVDLSGAVVEAGSSGVAVGSHVTNTGPTKSKNSTWQLTELVVEPGEPVPNGGVAKTTSAAPCSHKGGISGGTALENLPEVSCKNLDNGKNKVFNSGQTYMPEVSSNDVSDIPVGSKVCFVLSVKAYSSSNSKWRHSAPKCNIVGKRPKLQVLGGDIRSGGEINTSVSSKEVSGDVKTFGSWVEYASFSTSSNVGLASNSGLSEGNDSNSQRNWSDLTLANSQASGNMFGVFGTMPLERSVAGRFDSGDSGTKISSTSVDIDNMSAGNYYVQNASSNNLRLTGGSATIGEGKTIVIVTTGNVTINQNIRYFSGNMNSLDDIPRLVIVAGNININKKVTNIDAWLVSNNLLDTCADADDSRLTSKDCDKQLTVNGPVATKEIDLRRTAGSGTDKASGDPAETFQVNPSDYLWALGQASGDQRVQTTYTSELAPRF